MISQEKEQSEDLKLDSKKARYTSDELTSAIVEGAKDKKGEDILLLKVAEVSYLADFFVIITGFSRTQVRAIYNSIEEKVEEKYSVSPLRIEGKSEGTWILMDYGDVIVHIMLPEEREYYNIEAFWGHAEQIAVS